MVLEVVTEPSQGMASRRLGAKQSAALLCDAPRRRAPCWPQPKRGCDETLQQFASFQAPTSAPMGNDLCVASGANPHSMGIYLLNNSSKLLTLSDDGPCSCSSKHRGFDALHGKFKEDFAPPQRINANGGDYKCWVSGRDGSTVRPEGWCSYQVQGGGTLKFKYHYNDETVQVESTGPCSRSVTATVRREAIDAFMPKEFRGTYLQFRVTLSDSVDPQPETDTGPLSFNVKANVMDFEYPGWQEVMAGLTQRAQTAQAGGGANIAADCTFLDVIDIGPSQVNATINHSWDRTVTNEVAHTFHESMGLGMSMSIEARCPFVSVSTSFNVQSTLGRDQQWREVRHENVSKSVQLNYSEPGIYRTGCMFMGLSGYRIPFNALVMYHGSLSDGRHASFQELRDALRAQYPDINHDSLEEISQDFDGTPRCFLRRRITGEVFAKTATQMYTIVRRDA